MGEPDRRREALTLMRQGGGDEFIEQRTGLSLLCIVELRACLATAPAPKALGFEKAIGAPAPILF